MELQISAEIDLIVPPTAGMRVLLAKPQPAQAVGRKLAWLVIRQVGPADRVPLARHLISLPAQDRSARFGAPCSDEVIERHCEALNLSETLCFSAWDQSRVVAAAFGFLCHSSRGHRIVEVAVSVAPEHRRRHLGAELVARVCAASARRGAEGALFEFHPENAAIRGLVRHLGGWVTPLADSCLVPFAACVHAD